MNILPYDAVINQIHDVLEPGEELLEICDFMIVGILGSTTGVLTNRYVRFMGFKKSWRGKDQTIIANSSIPIHKVSAIAVSEKRFLGAKVFGLAIWWEGTKENLTTEMFDAGKSFAAKLQQLSTAKQGKMAGDIPEQITTKQGKMAVDIPEQIEKFAALREKGIISQQEFDTKKTDLLRMDGIATEEGTTPKADNTRVPCPNCSEDVKPSATICPFCKEPILSKNKVRNAFATLFIYIVTFVVIFFAINTFVWNQAEKDFKRIQKQTREIMRDIR
jgi:predicted nucleic acid-binding Zn ribbon protein